MNYKSKNLENTLVTIIKWGIYIALLTPLIVSSRFFYAFIVPKTTFFRVVVDVIFVAYAMLALNFPKYRPKFNALSIAVLIFIVLNLVSSFLGPNLNKSFWSVYERETGLFTFLHLYVFFIILTSVLKEKEEWDKVFWISIIVAIVTSLVTISGSSAASKGAGTIGNSSFLGTYLLFNIFFALSLLLEKKFQGLGLSSAISLMIILPVFLTSKARAAMISFFGGLVLIFVLSLFFSPEKKNKILAIIIPIALIVLLVSIYFLVPEIQEKINSQLTSMRARLVVWDIAWKGFLERPIFGWGLENFNVVFAKHFDPRLFLKEFGGEIWFDRSHNVVLDMMVNSGILGLISYLSIFFIAVFGLFKKAAGRERFNVSLTMVALLAAYFLQNITVFDVISSYVMFFLSLAFIYFLIEEEKNEEFEEKENENFFVRQTGTILAVVISGLALFGNIKVIKGATDTLKSVVFPKLEQKMEVYKETLENPKYNSETNRYFVTSLANYSFQEDKNQELLKEGLGLAERALIEDIQENNLDFRAYLSLAKAYVTDYRVTSDLAKLDLAEETLEEAMTINSNNPQTYWVLADIEKRRGNFEKAIEILREAVELEPRINDSYWYIISSYLEADKNEKALEELEKAEEKGFTWRNNREDFRNIIYLYEKIGDREKALSLYLELLNSNPNDGDLWMETAVELFSLGEKEKAQSVAQKALQLDPSLETRARKYLKAIFSED